MRELNRQQGNTTSSSTPFFSTDSSTSFFGGTAETESSTVTETEQSTTTTDETCSEETTRQIQEFLSHGIYGPESMTPGDTGVGGFEASYDPDAEMLNVNVRGKTRFVNGLTANGATVTSHETDLARLARLLTFIGDETLTNNIVNNYYTWNDAQKDIARDNLRNRISETMGLWMDPGYMFHIDEPCWENIFSNVNINIDVQDEGAAEYNGRNNSANDHLQVTLVKNPERNEMGTVSSQISQVAERVGDERMQCIDTEAGLTTGASVGSNRNRGTDVTDPYNSEMTLSNQSLENTPTELNNLNFSMLRTSVLFDNDQSTLDSTDRAVIDQFITNFREADANESNSRVRLIGHASRPGSTDYNRRLVNERINSVMNYLRERNFPNIETRVDEPENRSDEIAESLPDTDNNARVLRRVEIVVGEGELQNTVAHEFGHVFGLVDEYVTVGTSFSGTGTAAGTEVAHSDMSEAIGAGEARSENSDNIMSMGNEVRAQHYGPFGWALHRLTGKNWKI